MSFILHEYLEGHQIGRQLGIFDLPWDQICEIITEWRKLEPGEVSTFLLTRIATKAIISMSTLVLL